MAQVIPSEITSEVPSGYPIWFVSWSWWNVARPTASLLRWRHGGPIEAMDDDWIDDLPGGTPMNGKTTRWIHKIIETNGII